MVQVDELVGVAVAFKVLKTLDAAELPFAMSRLLTRLTLDAIASLEEARSTDANELYKAATPG